MPMPPSQTPMEPTRPRKIRPTYFCFATLDRAVGPGLCLGAIFTAFRLDRPPRSPEKVRGRPGGPTLPGGGRRTKSEGEGPLVSAPNHRKIAEAGEVRNRSLGPLPAAKTPSVMENQEQRFAWGAAQRVWRIGIGRRALRGKKIKPGSARAEPGWSENN
jgi:hypothetical protein